MSTALFIATAASSPRDTPDRTRAAPVPVVLSAADGVRVDGAFYRAARPRATILLFHQAGSGKGEYATIAPRLAAAGYDALAIDQRTGGGMFGPNLTAARLGRTAGYGEARRDLEAAADWAMRRGRPVVLWGSSYSAALVFQVAAARPRAVAAVVAFSPGEYLSPAGSIGAAAARVRVPIYVTSAADAREIAAARSILSASPSPRKTQFVPVHGVHGSSTLIAARNSEGAFADWRSVLGWLNGLEL